MSMLYFIKPARGFKSSFPLGNGKTAFFLYGGKHGERLDINDSRLWSGYPQNHDNARAKAAFLQARELALRGEYRAAHELLQEQADGDYTQAYMPLCSLFIKIFGGRGGKYARKLDLQTGVAEISCGKMTRTAFASHADLAAVYTLNSARPFSVKISASSPHPCRKKCEGDAFVLCGNAPDKALPAYLACADPIGYEEGKAMAFAFALRVHTDGTLLHSSKRLIVRRATFVHIYMDTETGFKGYDVMPETNAETVAQKCVKKVFSLSANAEELLARHVKDFSDISGRQALEISRKNERTDKLYRAARRGKADAALTQTLYDFGKYLLISGSRGFQPLNLQGQWNNSVRPPWSSNLTTNINFEMNYWAAGACALHECLVPFYRAAAEIAERGEQTARVNFGARGFCCNHNSDIWRNTSPVKGDPQYMFSPLCGAWIACEVFRQGKTTGGGEGADLIEKAALFCLDILAQTEKGLTVCPSVSPETRFACRGGQSAAGTGSAFELGIIRQTFSYCLQSSSDAELKRRVASTMAHLAPFEIHDGVLAEWSCGDSVEKGHRHFSPLFSVFPGEGFDDERLFEAAKNLFARRTANSSPGIGWSAAWAMCLAARFCDKKQAERAFYGFTSRSLLPGLYGFHPPCYFQIDGNLGWTAAINETLLTRKNGKLVFLPALLDVMPSGSMRGMLVEGAKLDFSWKNGKVTSARADKPLQAYDLNFSGGAQLQNITLFQAKDM